MATIEVVEAVQKSLENEGILQSIRAQLRANVLRIIASGPAYSPQGAAAVEFSKTAQGLLALSLVRDLLDHLSLKHTLTVFDVETGVESLRGRVGDRASLANELHLTELTDSRNCLLHTLLESHFESSREVSRTKIVPETKCAQTDDVYRSCAQGEGLSLRPQIADSLQDDLSSIVSDPKRDDNNCTATSSYITDEKPAVALSERMLEKENLSISHTSEHSSISSDYDHSLENVDKKVKNKSGEIDYGLSDAKCEEPDSFAQEKALKGLSVSQDRKMYAQSSGEDNVKKDGSFDAESSSSFESGALQDESIGLARPSDNRLEEVLQYTTQPSEVIQNSTSSSTSTVSVNSSTLKSKTDADQANISSNECERGDNAPEYNSDYGESESSDFVEQTNTGNEILSESKNNDDESSEFGDDTDNLPSFFAVGRKSQVNSSETTVDNAVGDTVDNASSFYDKGIREHPEEVSEVKGTNREEDREQTVSVNEYVAGDLAHTGPRTISKTVVASDNNQLSTGSDDDERKDDGSGITTRATISRLTQSGISRAHTGWDSKSGDHSRHDEFKDDGPEDKISALRGSSPDSAGIKAENRTVNRANRGHHDRPGRPTRYSDMNGSDEDVYDREHASEVEDIEDDGDISKPNMGRYQHRGSAVAATNSIVRGVGTVTDNDDNELGSESMSFEESEVSPPRMVHSNNQDEDQHDVIQDFGGDSFSEEDSVDAGNNSGAYAELQHANAPNTLKNAFGTPETVVRHDATHGNADISVAQDPDSGAEHDDEHYDEDQYELDDDFEDDDLATGNINTTSENKPAGQKFFNLSNNNRQEHSTVPAFGAIASSNVDEDDEEILSIEEEEDISVGNDSEDSDEFGLNDHSTDVNNEKVDRMQTERYQPTSQNMNRNQSGLLPGIGINSANLTRNAGSRDSSSKRTNFDALLNGSDDDDDSVSVNGGTNVGPQRSLTQAPKEGVQTIGGSGSNAHFHNDNNNNNDTNGDISVASEVADLVLLDDDMDQSNSSGDGSFSFLGSSKG